MAMQSGLPVGVAAFVGRKRERAKVAELVADARVVTLTGTGGCGKTRPLDGLPESERRQHATWPRGPAPAPARNRTDKGSNKNMSRRSMKLLNRSLITSDVDSARRSARRRVSNRSW
jgi:hypothetical protein